MSPRPLLLALATALALACSPQTDLPEAGEQPLAEQEKSLTLSCLSWGSTLYVDRSAATGGDGTSSKPFQTIPQALAHASAKLICDFTVFVRNGIYPEDVTVTRSLTIRGETRSGASIRGRVANSTAAALALDRLTLYDAAAPGALAVSHASASTSIANVTINSADRRGVYHSGGTLAIADSSIRYTAATAATPGEGAGLYLAGGAQATLSNVSFSSNAQAVVVTGAGTQLTATSLIVIGQTRNPHIDPAVGLLGLSAIEVASGSTLLAEYGFWSNNDFVALEVREGGRAHVRHTDVLGTKKLAVGTASYGGHNIHVRGAGSVLQLDDFESSRAFVGLSLREGGVIAAAHGALRDNTVGIAIGSGTSVEMAHCIDNSTITFAGNTYDSLWEVPPVPGTGNEGGAPPFICPTVAWR